MIKITTIYNKFFGAKSPYPIVKTVVQEKYIEYIYLAYQLCPKFAIVKVQLTYLLTKDDKINAILYNNIYFY